MKLELQGKTTKNLNFYYYFETIIVCFKILLLYSIPYTIIINGYKKIKNNFIKKV